MLRELIRRENIRVLSSNYALYGDIGRRVGETLASVIPTIETYSIVESFLNLTEFRSRNLEGLTRELRDRPLRRTGILTCVGFALQRLWQSWPTSRRRNGRSITGAAVSGDPRGRSADDSNRGGTGALAARRPLSSKSWE